MNHKPLSASSSAPLITPLTLLLGLCLAPFAQVSSAAPPAQALSPDAHLSLSPVSAPISAVEVAQGYATITRAGRVTVSTAGSLIQLPDLPSEAFGVKLKVQGADVLRLTQSQATPSKVDPKRLRLLTEALEQSIRNIRAIRARLQLIKEERSTITRLSSSLSGAEGKAPELTPKTERLWGELMRLDQRVNESITRRAFEMQAKLTELVPSFQRQLSEIETFNSSIRHKQVLEVLAYLRGSSNGERSFELSYLVQGPSWTPAHELHVDSTKSVVRRSLIAQVTQRSSEDWSGVKLSVTTNKFLQSPSKPRLLTWTLSEQDQFTPRLIARRSPNRPPLYPAPHPHSRAHEIHPRLKERAFFAQQKARDLLEYLRSGPLKLEERPLSMGFRMGVVGGFGGVGESSDARGSVAVEQSSKPPASPRPKPSSRSRSAPPPSTPSYPAALEADEAPHLAYAEDAPASKRSARRRSRFGFDDMTRYQAPSGPLKPRYTFTAPNPAVIPTNGQPVSIPLMVKESPVTLVYEVTPDLSPYVYLTGKAKHTDKLPILKGPARLFSDGGYVGEAQLNETLPGELWTAPLGADPELKVKRHLEVKTVTKGLINKDEVSTYQVKIQVANYKRRRVSLKVYDALPVSETDEVEVTLLRMKPKAELSDPKEGLLTWTLDLKPGERRELLLTYSIKRPEGWRVYQ